MLTYYTATTLDGFLADEHDSLDWLFRQEHDESGPFGMEAFMAGIGAIVMGSTTYEWVLAHEDGPWPYAIPSWVMTSRDLAARDGGDLRFASGDVRPVFEAMTAAAGGKDLWLVGGGDLAGQFAEAGLLDEVVVSVAPVTLGAGRPLLPRRLDLELVESAVNGAFVSSRYRVTGPLREDRS
ncbi:dihydrofolate reductase family protein [Blastococcus sp. LR1]|uniref:dihydrofolate reductase family protein n=1 Tax=Blastococcus sp. LR1 TaxID=2877000 RepID=UPI001CCA4AC4|nr:dihydrofolate reductase family protein [Blastococcus sp. LR1]MCA0144718.1 dihydrofolate reductase family protein [Blastococcus sp. LR1]